MMAFETRSLVNGSWTTRTLDVNTVLRHYDQQDKDATTNDREIEKVPKFGILSQTVVRSPVVHWILPARLRAAYTQDIDAEYIFAQDVAFVGDDFVQIKELRGDGLLWNIARKENFGGRIRNARVLGALEDLSPSHPGDFEGTRVKDEIGDHEMDIDDAPSKMSKLPPQVIVLQLDTGDSVFLALVEDRHGNLSFKSSRYRVSKSMLKLQPGLHLAINPSSRFMAIGCTEGIFAIYSLFGREQLEKQLPCAAGLRYVESERYVHFKGVIQKMEFLHPEEGDDDHIILLLLVVHKGRTRMLVYEWDLGDDLARIRPHGQKGHLLEESRQMPLLLIPTKIKSSFILVCEDSMCICQDVLQRSPTFIEFSSTIDPPTNAHHGSGVPLWTAWARPYRHNPRFKRDDLYLVREDGMVKIVEVDPEEDDLVTTHNNIGELGVACGSALASIGYDPLSRREKSGDLLLSGGDSCSGGTFLVQARRSPVFIQTIQNWSPSQDFVTTYNAQDRDLPGASQPVRPHLKVLQKPDRIFACGGKGAKGAITEFRHGLEANIVLETEYEEPIMQAWVLYPSPGSIEDYDCSLFLLSVGARSAVLQLNHGFSDISELGEESTSFDLRARTIAAAMHNDWIIQVTEKSIVLINGAYVRILEKQEILSLSQGDEYSHSGLMIDDAAIAGDLVVFTTRIGPAVYLQTLSIEKAPDDMEVDDGQIPIPSTTVRTLARLPEQISSLTICNLHGIDCAVVAGLDEEQSIILIFQPIAGGDNNILKVPSVYGNSVVELEAIVSVAMVLGQNENLVLLCGTRNGIVLTLEINETELEIVNSRYNRIGASTVMLSRDPHEVVDDLFLMTCDSSIFALIPVMSKAVGSLKRRWLRSVKVDQIWLTNTLSPGLRQPDINSLARLRPMPVGTEGCLLLSAGSQLLLTGLSMQPKTVPRSILVGGTPTRLLYSHALEVIIVAASINGRSTILFLDPDTGANLSQPVDQKTKAPVEFVSGLGNERERIFCLFEWAYTKNGKTWNFIIVSTSTGRLLILSIDQVQVKAGIDAPGNSSQRSKIIYYTRHKFRCADPVYSVTGFTDGLLWCSGEKLYCDTLDLAEKKFKRVAEYDLPSPASNLIFDDGIIYVLTTCHSLEILKLEGNGITESQIVRTHGDPVARFTMHHAILDRIDDRPIHLVSDKMCSLVGLWPTKDAKADTLEPIFEAELPNTILKFRFGRCRPVWDPVWNQICNRPTTEEDNSLSLEYVPKMISLSETLGLSINGSLTHFTFLNPVAWKFLRFLLDMAIRSPKICELALENDSVPLEQATEPLINMHINGDILKQVLEGRNLEELLKFGEISIQAQLLQEKFAELLRELHEGKLRKNDPAGLYIDQGYADLELFLRPVM